MRISKVGARGPNGCLPLSRRKIEKMSPYCGKSTRGGEGMGAVQSQVSVRLGICKVALWLCLLKPDRSRGQWSFSSHSSGSSDPSTSSWAKHCGLGTPWQVLPEPLRAPLLFPSFSGEALSLYHDCQMKKWQLRQVRWLAQAQPGKRALFNIQIRVTWLAIPVLRTCHVEQTTQNVSVFSLSNRLRLSWSKKGKGFQTVFYFFTILKSGWR